MLRPFFSGEPVRPMLSLVAEIPFVSIPENLNASSLFLGNLTFVSIPENVNSP